jgi:glycosyltransferase involved in cell wall biosynthesis
MMRLALVLPRYGPKILGGAETTARDMAEQLVRRGHTVTVLTTCIRDYATWQNVDPAGTEIVNGVTVERYPIRQGWRTPTTEALSGRLPSATTDEQYDWVHHQAHAPGLYRKLITDGRRYDLIFFIPYLYTTAYYGSALVNERAVIWPCLHNELFAHLHPTRAMLAAARGVLFNSRAERDLAHQLGARNPREFVVGVGIDERVGDADRFRSAQGLAEPYLIYAGRLEEAKNVHALVEYFSAYKQTRGGDLKLVLTGDGALRNAISHPDLVFTGYLSDQMLQDAIAGAVALCQPSLMESFSIVIMQAWILGVPVLVHAGCAVTTEHVQAGQGGVTFADATSFARSVDALVGDQELRARLGAQGGQYARADYSWQAVIDRMEAALEAWKHDD